VVGVFDSGRGGALAVTTLHRKLPRADIAFFGDFQNAPYGTKTEAQLITLIQKDVDRLKTVGSVHILSACCTASSLIHKLPPSYRDSCFSIIPPTVNVALQKTKNRRIGVLATLATVRSHVFQNEMQKTAPDVLTLEIPAQSLVTLAEGGKTDKDDVDVKRACRLCAMAFGTFGMDTLILGCTHFPLFSGALSSFFPNVSFVSSVEAGVCAFTETLSEDEKNGSGKLRSLS